MAYFGVICFANMGGGVVKIVFIVDVYMGSCFSPRLTAPGTLRVVAHSLNEEEGHGNDKHEKSDGREVAACHDMFCASRATKCDRGASAIRKSHSRLAS